MRKLGLGILITSTVLILSGIAVAKIVPAKNLVIVSTDQIEKGVFVDYGYNSPPWYPQDCSKAQYETDTYRWAPEIHWATTTPPINVYTGGEPISGTFEPIKAAFETWDATTSFALYGTTTEYATSGPGVKLDGKNTVQWASIDGPGGIIGATYYWYYKATKEMVEFDIVLDSSDPWSLTGASDTFDVQNVATHEAGHTLVLQDIYSPKDCGLTMHAYTWKGDILKRTLAPGDVLGVQAIYGE
jgi:hypothetical protein